MVACSRAGVAVLQPLPPHFHRVKNPLPGDSMGPRYSLAFFCQAHRDTVTEEPAKKYPAMGVVCAMAVPNAPAARAMLAWMVHGAPVCRTHPGPTASNGF